MDAWVSTIVVDNDSDPTVRDIVESFGSQLPGLRYLTEQEPGVVAVRNRIIESSDTDLVACVDDDMTVDRRWLLELVAAVRPGIGAVVGRCVAQYAADLPEAVRDSGVLEYEAPTPGEPVPVLTGGCCLLVRAALPVPPFDPELGRIGGEDFDLGLALGPAAVVGSGAVAHEWIGPAEATGVALRRRARRFGAAWVAVMHRRGANRTMLAARCVGRLVVFGPMLRLGSPEKRVRRRHEVDFGVGGLRQLLGLPVSGY